MFSILIEFLFNIEREKNSIKPYRLFIFFCSFCSFQFNNIESISFVHILVRSSGKKTHSGIHSLMYGNCLKMNFTLRHTPKKSVIQRTESMFHTLLIEMYTVKKKCWSKAICFWACVAFREIQLQFKCFYFDYKNSINIHISINENVNHRTIAFGVCCFFFFRHSQKKEAWAFFSKNSEKKVGLSQTDVSWAWKRASFIFFWM